MAIHKKFFKNEKMVMPLMPNGKLNLDAKYIYLIIFKIMEG
jgi:hypothetical protein